MVPAPMTRSIRLTAHREESDPESFTETAEFKKSPRPLINSEYRDIEANVKYKMKQKLASEI